jgi:hypothetical protein
MREEGRLVTKLLTQVDFPLWGKRILLSRYCCINLKVENRQV